MAAGVVAALGLLVAGGVMVGLFVLHDIAPRHPFLPVYALEQTDSTHPWYRRTTVKLGATVYVNDFEEASLLLFAVIPTNAIGRPPFGNSVMCSIDGQSTNDYVAVDCGSEMEAYEVFRNVQRPAFDWRHAKFQSMEIGSPTIHPERKRSTDPALIAEVVRILSAGTPTPEAELPAALTSCHQAGAVKNLTGLQMLSDELPGLIFCPLVYRDDNGAFYLAESTAIEFTNRLERIHANWIPAGPRLTPWLQTR